MPSATKTRLSREDWMDAGLRALCADGPGALRAEPLARTIGVTKGSFYWHFTDVPDFHTALLARWEGGILTTMQAILAAPDTETTRLRRLCQTIAAGSAAEPAIRAWALGTGPARDSLARVDAGRLAHLRDLLEALDIGNPEMAHILLAAATGMAALSASGTGTSGGAGTATEAIGTLVDLVLALR